MCKIDELLKTNKLVKNHIKFLNNLCNDNAIIENDTYFPEMIFKSDNKSTSTKIYKLKKGMMTKIKKDNFFYRIVCTSGKIKIHLIPFNDTVTITSQNTQLIVPNVEYIIEVLEDSELINIYEPSIKGEYFTIRENESIYNKKLNNYE